MCQEEQTSRTFQDVQKWSQVVAGEEQRCTKAAAALKHQPTRLGLEQVLRAAEASQLHAELTLGKACTAAYMAQRKAAAAEWRLGRARNALIKLAKKAKQRQQKST